MRQGFPQDNCVTSEILQVWKCWEDFPFQTRYSAKASTAAVSHERPRPQCRSHLSCRVGPVHGNHPGAINEWCCLLNAALFSFYWASSTFQRCSSKTFSLTFATLWPQFLTSWPHRVTETAPHVFQINIFQTLVIDKYIFLSVFRFAGYQMTLEKRISLKKIVILEAFSQQAKHQWINTQVFSGRKYWICVDMALKLYIKHKVSQTLNKRCILKPEWPFNQCSSAIACNLCWSFSWLLNILKQCYSTIIDP